VKASTGKEKYLKKHVVGEFNAPVGKKITKKEKKKQRSIFGKGDKKERKEDHQNGNVGHKVNDFTKQ